MRITLPLFCCVLGMAPQHSLFRFTSQRVSSSKYLHVSSNKTLGPRWNPLRHRQRTGARDTCQMWSFVRPSSSSSCVYTLAGEMRPRIVQS